MSRFKPLIILFLLQPVLFILALLVWWWYTRRQNEMVYTFVSERSPDEPDTPELSETEEAPTVQQADDLKKIEGIGPKISAILQSSGITTYTQLAGVEVQSLKTILEQGGIRNASPDTWPDQASLAAAEEWDALKSLQAQLKGGRRA